MTVSPWSSSSLPACTREAHHTEVDLPVEAEHGHLVADADTDGSRGPGPSTGLVRRARGPSLQHDRTECAPQRLVGLGAGTGLTSRALDRGGGATEVSHQRDLPDAIERGDSRPQCGQVLPGPDHQIMGGSVEGRRSDQLVGRASAAWPRRPRPPPRGRHRPGPRARRSAAVPARGRRRTGCRATPGRASPRPDPEPLAGPAGPAAARRPRGGDPPHQRGTHEHDDHHQDRTGQHERRVEPHAGVHLRPTGSALRQQRRQCSGEADRARHPHEREEGSGAAVAIVCQRAPRPRARRTWSLVGHLGVLAEQAQHEQQQCRRRPPGPPRAGAGWPRGTWRARSGGPGRRRSRPAR